MQTDVMAQNWVGLDKDAYSWDCPLCTFKIFPNLSQAYVYETLESHLRTQHNVEGVVNVSVWSKDPIELEDTVNKHRKNNPGHSAGELLNGTLYCIDCTWRVVPKKEGE